MDTFDWHMLLTSGATCRMSLRACLRTATVRAPFGSQVTGYGKPQLNLSSFYSDCSLGVWLSVHRFNHRPNQWSGQDGGLRRTWVTSAPSHILEQWKLENYHLPLPVHTPLTGTVFHSHWKIFNTAVFPELNRTGSWNLTKNMSWEIQLTCIWFMETGEITPRTMDTHASQAEITQPVEYLLGLMDPSTPQKNGSHVTLTQWQPVRSNATGVRCLLYKLSNQIMAV